MISISLKKKLYKTLLLLPIIMFQTSCLNFFGVKTLDKLNSNVQLKPSQLDKYSNPFKYEDLEFELHWIGAPTSVSTDKNALGMTTRFVIPYTRKTSIFKLKINNKSSQIARISPEDITLTMKPSMQTIKPLQLNYFKNQWPTHAVQTDQMVIDQSLAISRVIQTITNRRMIPPNKSVEHLIPFRKLSSTVESVKLVIDNAQLGNRKLKATFQFQKEK